MIYKTRMSDVLNNKTQEYSHILLRLLSMYKSQLTNVSWQTTNIVSIYFHLLRKIQQVTTPDLISLVILYTLRKIYFKESNRCFPHELTLTWRILMLQNYSLCMDCVHKTRVRSHWRLGNQNLV